MSCLIESGVKIGNGMVRIIEVADGPENFAALDDLERNKSPALLRIHDHVEGFYA